MNRFVVTMSDPYSAPSAGKEEAPLTKAAQFLLDECRMVLPGIQALFGFQLMVVFNERFAQKLTDGQQGWHLTALALIAVAIAIIMTPAAYHRQRGVRHVTEHFLAVSSRLILAAMAPLALGLCIDFYLVAVIILKDEGLALALAAALAMLFVVLWLGLPHWMKRTN